METHTPRDAHSPEAATDEPASPFNPSPGALPLAPRVLPEPLPKGYERPEEPFEFASAEEEDAYWAGVVDGMRTMPEKVPPRLAARARDRYPELMGAVSSDVLEFDPVSTRHRIDGWSPEKQREYVEALADTGVARYAAARVGMTEQSANRLRRRADGRSFDLACRAAQQIGARNLVSIACTRAIEGTMRKRYWRGEEIGEERVYDNRLLVALITKVLPALEPTGEVAAIAAEWGPFVDAIAEGRPVPDLRPAPCDGDALGAAEEAELEDEEEEEEDEPVWQESDGTWWTRFAPPDDFLGDENGTWGQPWYRRTLSDDELDWVAANLVGEHDEALAEARADRDAYFGFAGDPPPWRPAASEDGEGSASHGNGAELSEPSDGAETFGNGDAVAVGSDPDMEPEGEPRPSPSAGAG